MIVWNKNKRIMLRNKMGRVEEFGIDILHRKDFDEIIAERNVNGTNNPDYTSDCKVSETNKSKILNQGYSKIGLIKAMQNGSQAYFDDLQLDTVALKQRRVETGKNGSYVLGVVVPIKQDGVIKYELIPVAGKNVVNYTRSEWVLNIFLITLLKGWEL